MTATTSATTSAAQDMTVRRGGREARRAARAAPLPENQQPVRAGMEGGRYKPLSDAEVLKIHNASQLFTMAQGKSNLVAAIPSLHAGLTMLLALFMWPRVKALGKTLFMAYPFAMAFALVFTAEHYVIDILLGWALAASVIAVCRWVDRRWLIPRQQRLHAEQDDAAAIEVTNQKQELNI